MSSGFSSPFSASIVCIDGTKNSPTANKKSKATTNLGRWIRRETCCWVGLSFASITSIVNPDLRRKAWFVTKNTCKFSHESQQDWRAFRPEIILNGMRIQKSILACRVDRNVYKVFAKPTPIKSGRNCVNFRFPCIIDQRMCSSYFQIHIFLLNSRRWQC